MAIEGADEARRVAGVEDVVVTAKAGDVIPPPGGRRPSAAMVLATGDTREAALAAATEALSKLRIRTA
jgi:biotin carboxylase